MASIGTYFTIGLERRLCKVDDQIGYFHCWENYADVVSTDLIVGSHPGGQFSRVYGIVEFKDRVKRVEPYKIKFINEENAVLNEMENDKL